ncbi:MAG: hypothetical protein QOE82_1948 [Thermoanaerobaculia bacterium]|nr:hypothetical protein [Thermoanaerobaculia bacterium]
MKRSITDVLRRGLDSTIANWPVIALRIAESLVLIGIVIAAIIVAIVPAVVAAGLSWGDIANSSDPPAEIIGWLIAHAMLFVWMFALAFIVLGVMIAIHSFADGGAAQIYVDAERSASGANRFGRAAFDAFSIDRWLAGGASSWWRIFWVYNFAWSVGLLFVLVPLMFTIAGMLLISDQVGKIVIGCAGLALAVLVLIPVCIVTSVWCTKAITICVARSLPARESLRVARRAVRADLGRHVAIVVIMFVVSMAINSLVSGFSIPMTLSEHRMPPMALIFTPVRIVAGFIQSIVSAAVGSWLLACFVSMTEER